MAKDKGWPTKSKSEAEAGVDWLKTRETLAMKILGVDGANTHPF